eukprot:153889-Pyramimonas_sp.AAC.1
MTVQMLVTTMMMMLFFSFNDAKKWLRHPARPAIPKKERAGAAPAYGNDQLQSQRPIENQQ